MRDLTASLLELIRRTATDLPPDVEKALRAARVRADHEAAAVLAQVPALVLGAAVLARALEVARHAGAIRDDWNGFCVLHTAAARVGGNLAAGHLRGELEAPAAAPAETWLDDAAAQDAPLPRTPESPAASVRDAAPACHECTRFRPPAADRAVPAASSSPEPAHPLNPAAVRPAESDREAHPDGQQRPAAVE